MASANPVNPPVPAPETRSWLAGREWLLLLVPLLAVAATFTLSYLWNEDFWWYVTSGRYLLDHHHFPSHDPFLYTADKGIGWVYHSWLWTVLVAMVHQLSGLGGVVVLHTLIGIALCIVLYTTARVDRLGLANALAVTFFLAVLGERLTGKAEIATWLMLAIFYRLFDTDRGFTWKRGAVLGALQILWANLHGGYPLGIFVALCYSVGPWIEAWLRKETAPVRRPPIWFPAVLFLLAVADPWLFRERLAPFAFVTGSQSVQPVGASGNVLILEWQSPFHVAAIDATPLWFFGLAVVAGLASFALARRRPLARVLFFLGMAVLGATAGRHLPGLALSAALVILSNLQGREWRKPAPQPKRGKKAAKPAPRARPKWLYATVCGLVALTLLGAAVALRVARPGFEGGQSGESKESSFFAIKPSITCPGAASFILEHGLPGPIFNDFQMGAYLGYRLHPTYRLFVDSRVLDPSIVVRYTEIVSTPGRWKEAEDRYGFRTVVLGNFSKTLRSPLGQALQQDPRWRLLYMDPLAVVFVKDSFSIEPAVLVTESQRGRVPFVPPASFVPPLPLLQRVFLHDFPANYLVEHLAVLGQLGHPRDAIELATQALESQPDQPLLYRQRCAAHFAVGEVQEAISDCKAAYDRGPEDPQIVALYAMVLSRVGRGGEARFLVQKALEKNPGDETLQRIKPRLQ
jgi:Tetratricopeptide repeat